MTPAFKEWQAVVGALTAGEQTILLRKGGIAEGRGGFRVGAERFWLFPTRFHAQREKVKPTALRYFADASAIEGDSGAGAPSPATPVAVTAYADLVEAWFVADWARVAALDPWHVWTESTVRERFDWSRATGVHVLLVRIHRLLAPRLLEPTPEMAGCRSWIELPLDFTEPAMPVLDDATFAARAAAVRACVAP